MAAPGERHIEHHAQRVDIGGGGDRAARDLFGACVFRRQDIGCGVIGSGRRFLAEQFGDAEIEQFWAAIGGDENVGGLEVTVNDQMLVGVADGVADADHQPDALLERGLPLTQPAVERDAVDEFHHEIGKSLRGGAAVDERGDARMRQPGQQKPLLAELFGQFPAHESSADQLQREARLEALALAEGFKDNAHAAASDLAHQAPGANAPPLPVASEGLLDGGMKGEGRVFEEIFRAGVLFQKMEDFALDRRIGACSFKPRAALAGIEPEGVAEEAFYLLPVFCVHGRSPSAAGFRTAGGEAAMDPGLGQQPVPLHGGR